MFSATKFVVAGAIVALFGGFLLAGVLTQPSEESMPAVAASASPEPGASYVVSRVTPGPEGPLRTTASAATDDALWVPGTDRLWRFDRVTGDATQIEGLSGVWPLVPTEDAVWAIEPGAVHRIDRVSLTVTDSIEASDGFDVHGGLPLIADGSLWLTSSQDGRSTLVEIDLGTMSIRHEYATDDEPSRGYEEPGLVAVEDAIWLHTWDTLGGRQGQRLTRFDLESRVFTDSFDIAGVGSWDCCIALDDAIWLVEQTGTLRRFDLETLEVTDMLQLNAEQENQVFGSVVADGAIWVSVDDVYRIDPETRQVTDVIEVGSSPERPAFLHGAIWVADHGDRTVSRIDPESRLVTDKIEFPVSHLHTPLASSDVIWVYTQEGGVYRIDREAMPKTEATATPLAEERDDSATTTSDLLSGVDLVTEEVEPGVERIVSDGIRDLSAVGLRRDRDLAVTRDGAVWLYTSPPDTDPVVWEDATLIRLGDPDSHAEGVEHWLHLEVSPDGALLMQAWDAGPSIRRLGGEGWTEFGRMPLDGPWDIAADGTVWVGGAGGTVERLDASGWQDHPIDLDIQRLVDYSDEIAYSGGGGPTPTIADLAVDTNGDVWAALSVADFTTAPMVLLHYDRETWSLVDPLGAGKYANVDLLDVGPDGTMWVYLETGFPPGTERPYLARLADDRWTVFSEEDGVVKLVWLYDSLGLLRVDQDGAVWVAPQDPSVSGPPWRQGLRAFDGTTWRQYLDGHIVRDMEVAPDGKVWVATRGDVFVITPEAVAVAE